MLLIDPKDAFAHVVYEYRCLVRAQYVFMQSARLERIAKESSFTGRNAVLLKSRSLIEFYTNTNPRDTDITAKEYFAFDLESSDQALHGKLSAVSASMEVHDIHLTAWRDETYRNTRNSALKETERQRIDWNKEQSSIVDNLILVLNVWHRQIPSWSAPIALLNKTCLQVLKDGGNWEQQLGGTAEVNTYLAALEL